MSPYRLAAHLTSAAVIYGTLLWTSLSLAFPLSPAAAAPAGSAAAAGAAILRRWAHPIAGLIALTALSGIQLSMNPNPGHALSLNPCFNLSSPPPAIVLCHSAASGPPAV